VTDAELGALVRAQAQTVVVHDAIRPRDALAKDWGMEPGGFANWLAQHGVSEHKIGRQVAVRISDVLAACDRAAAAKVPQTTPSTTAPAGSALARLVAESRRAG
jgi:hypothetical protein